MFLYDCTNKAISNYVYDNKYGLYRRYGNARWLDHDWVSSMLHSRKVHH